MDLLQIALGMGIATTIAEDEKKKRERNTIKIPDNATNGDVIKAVFPNAEIIMPNDPTDDVTVDIHGVSSFLYFDLKWWNAPYNRESEE